MPATRARERLVKMTGSDNVNLIDSNYMAMLHEKFWQEYEDELDHQEKLRMETEKNRVRKLMVQGYITPEQLHQEDKVTYKEQTNKKNRSSNTKKNATTNGKNIVSTAKTNGTVDINSSTKENDETEVSKSVHYQSDHVTENNEESTQRVSDEVSSEEKETLKQSLSNGSEQNTISNHNEEETKELAANSSQPPVKYTPKYMEPRLIELYNQESVQALYDKAEQLIPPLSTLMHKSSSKKRVTLG